MAVKWGGGGGGGGFREGARCWAGQIEVNSGPTTGPRADVGDHIARTLVLTTNGADVIRSSAPNRRCGSRSGKNWPRARTIRFDGSMV